MRKKYLLSASLLLASLALVGAGCGQNAAVSPSAPAGQQAAPVTRQPVAAPAPAAVPSTTTADVCGNPYYPFKPGLAITYGVTPSPAANSDYTIRVVSVTGATAAIRAEMAAGVTADMEADCANGTVAMKGTFDLGAAAKGMTVKTTLVSSSGTFMPADVAAGSTWSNTQTVKMETSGGTGEVAAMGPITSTTTEQSKAVGQESVTVPAGTFDALKVEVTRTITSELAGPPPGVTLPPGMKLPTPPPTTSTSTEWWVKGIGLVKTVTTTQGATSTVEAKANAGL